MFITTSGTSFTFCQVCLVVLFLILLPGEKITIGGVVENKLKKLKGLRLIFPSLSIVEAKQMGLGAIACCSQFCLSTGFRSFKSTIMIQISAKLHSLIQPNNLP